MVQFQYAEEFWIIFLNEPIRKKFSRIWRIILHSQYDNKTLWYIILWLHCFVVGDIGILLSVYCTLDQGVQDVTLDGVIMSSLAAH